MEKAPCVDPRTLTDEELRKQNEEMEKHLKEIGVIKGGNLSKNKDNKETNRDKEK